MFFQVLSAGFVKLGFGPDQVLLLWIGTFIGSTINIPIKEYYTEHVEPIAIPTFFGMRYTLPMLRRTQHTVLAVNVGGCVIPVAVSMYLLAKWPGLVPSAVICVGICSWLTHRMARVVPGVGIALPFFMAPLTSAFLAILIAPAGLHAPVAYVTGSLGTLIGADLLNVRRIATLGSRVASIGGAGTWDGIFLSGILASVLTG